MNVLFLCTGNSARSILGEVIFNELFSAHGCAFSAGSAPVGEVNPAALVVLEKYGRDVAGLRSKNVDEFAGGDAPVIDLVISVCDSAALDCSVWSGAGEPGRLHWPLSDPAVLEGEAEKAEAFEETYRVLNKKISALFS